MSHRNVNITLLTETYYPQSKSSEIIQEFYDEETNTLLWQSKPLNSLKKGNTKSFYLIENVPSCLNVKYYIRPNYKLWKFYSVKGFAMKLEEVNSVEAYMKQFLPKKVRANINRSMRRLEHSFPIRYKRYYGEISRENYNYLMTALKEMIVTRFKERGENSNTLSNWDSIYENGLILIKEKKASLYVIYDDQSPISISLSYHYGKVFFYYITSYNIDYSKFSLGNTMIVKQLEWCYENKLSILDMGWGDLDYKRRWCNLNYKNTNDLVLPKKIQLAHFPVFYIFLKKSIIAYLVDKNIHTKFRNLKKLLIGAKTKSPATNFNTLYIDNKEKNLNHKPVSLSDYPFIKPYVYRFLYNAMESISDIAILKSNNNENCFYVIGINKAMKIFEAAETDENF
ncbi:GNAT family N-acetyltransferase [Eudoraea chungangensis]|uniref:GNAT family N-acetyltransferase n=1 Tax=Eudoraea chungangensis TaxID=1481905 RepID=UPI0023EDE0AF|nr:GNAT family N-acetyltransferase [Eudoraea chungangensis]